MSDVSRRAKDAAFLYALMGRMDVGVRDYWIGKEEESLWRWEKLLRILREAGDPFAAKWDAHQVNADEFMAKLLMATEDILWAQYGLNVFDLTHSLCASLVLTEPSGNLGLPRLPFPSFPVRVPAGFVPLCYEDGSINWADHLWTSVVEGTPYMPEDLASHTRELSQLSAWPDQRMTISASRGLYSNEMTAWSICEEQFVSTRASLRSLACEEADWHVVGEGPRIVRQDVTRHAALRIVANLCSWMEASGGTTGLRHTITSRPIGEPDAGKPIHWILGRDVKLERELLDAAKAQSLCDRKTSALGWRIKSRFVVRGHVRNQACGAGMLEHKTIWIAPYWKGPTGFQTWRHVYKCQEEKTC